MTGRVTIGQAREMGKGQPVSQLRFKFTRAMVTGLDTISARRIQVHSMMPEVLSALRASFRKITILTSLPVLEVFASADFRWVMVEQFFAGQYGAHNNWMI